MKGNTGTRRWDSGRDVRCARLVMTLVLIGVQSMANAQQTPEEIAADTARYTAEAARLTARTAVENAEAAYAAAQRARAQAANLTTTPLADLQAQLAIENANRDLAIATTDSRIAQTIGTVRNASYTGAVELKEKAGMLEAKLLATKAVHDAAQRIATAVRSSVTDMQTVVLAPGSSFKAPERIAMYRFRVAMLRKVLGDALDSAAAGGVEAAGLESVAALPAVASAGLEAAGKLLSFFKTDYSIGGLDVALDESVAMYAVAGALGPHALVKMPVLHLPSEKQAAIETIMKDVSELLAQRQRAEALALVAAARVKRAERELTTAKDDVKGDIQDEIVALTASEAQLKSAVSAFDAFTTGLITPAGTPAREPLADLLSDLALDSVLTQAPAAGGKTPLLLLIRLEGSGGGILLKKNLFTGLGAPPLFHMGGAAVSYLLLEGATGRVLQGDTIAQHGGYTQSSKMGQTLGQ